MPSSEVEEHTGEHRAATSGLPESLTHRTGFLLSTLGRRFRDATERALAPLGIKPVHYGVLAVLSAQGPAAQWAVGEKFRIDKSSMVVIVDHLERLNLVERRRNPRNRRAYELILTDAGRNALLEADRIIARSEEGALAPLDKEQRAQLHELLLRLLLVLGEPHTGR